MEVLWSIVSAPTFISALRKDIKAVETEKAKVEQEKLSLAELTDSLKKEMEAREIEITQLKGRLTVNLMDKLLHLWRLVKLCDPISV